MGILFFIVLMDLLGFGIIIPLLPLYAQQYRASPLEVGLLFSVFSICQFISSPILGAYSDRHGRRPVLVYSQLGSAVGYLLLGLVMQFHWSRPTMALGLFYLSRLIDGISGGNVSTAQAYVSDVTTPENRARGMGVIGAAFGVGFAIGPFVGGVLAGVNPALPGYFAAAASLCAMFMTLARLPETRVHRPAEVAIWLHPSRFRPILDNKRLVQLLAIVFFSMCGFVMLESMLALFTSRSDTFGWGPRDVGLYFGYIGLIIAIVQGGLIGRITKKVGDWPPAIVGPILVSLAMINIVYMGYHAIFWMMIVGGALNAVGRSMQTPTLFALVSKNSDPRQQGVVFGLNQGLGSLARVIGPVVGGVLYAVHPTGPFVLAAGLSLIVCLWMATLRVRG
jgi:MFS transporter, DHA1 family, tetracycline resistance protein